MKNNYRALVAFLLVTNSAHAGGAASADRCGITDAQLANVEICEDNRFLSTAAANCVRTFDAAVKGTEASLREALVRDFALSQRNAEISTKQNAQTTGTDLAALLWLNEEMLGRLRHYRKVVVMPVDDSAPMDIPCYGPDVRSIDASVAAMESRRQDLTAAAGANNALGVAARGATRALENKAPAANEPSGKRSAIPLRDGADGRRESGISGTALDGER